MHPVCVIPFLSFISHSYNPPKNVKTKALQKGRQDFVTNYKPVVMSMPLTKEL